MVDIRNTEISCYIISIQGRIVGGAFLLLFHVFVHMLTFFGLAHAGLFFNQTLNNMSLIKPTIPDYMQEEPTTPTIEIKFEDLPRVRVFKYYHSDTGNEHFQLICTETIAMNIEGEIYNRLKDWPEKLGLEDMLFKTILDELAGKLGGASDVFVSGNCAVEEIIELKKRHLIVLHRMASVWQTMVEEEGNKEHLLLMALNHHIAPHLAEI